MAGNLSNYLENKLLDHFLGVTSYTMPTPIYLALFTSAPSDSVAGTEVTGGSYVRKAITFSAASSGATSNSGDVDFTGMPACTVVAVGIYDALTTGNLLVWSDLLVSKVVGSGDTLRIPTGDFDISLD